MKISSLLDIIKNNQDWLEILKEKPYCLRIKQDPKNEFRYIFTYSMIDSDMSLDVVQVSRGLVLYIKTISIFDKGKDYRKDKIEKINDVSVETYAFDKFFNLGESNCAKLDWSFPVYGSTKEDGSIIKYRGGLWSTNNSFNADAELPGDDIISPYATFQELINDALAKWSLETQELIYQFSQRGTLMFEITSSYNKIVVNYNTDAELILLGMRYADEPFKEVSYDDLRKMFPAEIKMPKRYQFNSIEEAQIFVDNLPANNEGIVLCDSHFNRVKLKTSWYTSRHHLKDSNGQLSFKHLFMCIQDGSIDDVIAAFPEHSVKINELLDKYRTLCEDIDSTIKLGRIRVACAEESWGTDLKEQKKQYALMAKDHPVPSILFDVWKYQDDTSKIKANFLEKLDYDKFIEVSNKFEGRPYE